MIGRFVLIGTVVLVAGCAAVPSRTGPSPLASQRASPVTSPSARSGQRVVALVGTVGAMALLAPGTEGRDLEAVDGAAVPPNAAWLSGDGSTFVLTTLDGRIVVGGLTELGLEPGDLGEPHALREFGSLEPELAAGTTTGARRLAFGEGDPGSGGPGRITVMALDGRVIRRIILPRAAESPPAWLPDGRFAVVSRDSTDRPETLLVDPATGRIETLPGPPLRSVGTAADVVRGR